MHNPDDKPSYFLILFTFSNFFNSHANMSTSHGYRTIGRMDGGRGEDKKKETVSHQLGISTGYGDVHQ